MTQYKNGASQKNVPDMPQPAVGDGTATFYWPNGASGRLMFYHDHAYGITRLDVYAGEAAGYLLVDPIEQALNPAGGQLPLIIQDKTFVNIGNFPVGFLGVPPLKTAVADPLWAANPKWGQLRGSLWFPHVYMPNQNPNDISGANPMGRWDYGPWFWPVFPVIQSLAQTSAVPEAFMDTPLVNGTAYPYVNMDPTTYRFRILNACNDRYLNLQFYVAEPLSISVINGGSGYSATPTVTVTDPTGAGAVAQADVAGGVIQKIRVTAYGNSAYSAPVVAITDPTGTGAVASASANTEVRMIPAAKGTGVAAGALTPGTLWPAEWTANDTPGMIPNILDNRPGGVPDPSLILQGPKFVHIGSEGGIASAPVVMVNTPIGYEQNKRSVTVLNTMEHTLFIGPAERADVFVDFSQYAGKTIIMYNDAPAPLPAGDPRYDYYTDGPDNRSQGGAPSTIAGYGPNMRTIMQIRVGNTAPAQPVGSITVQAGGSGYTAPTVALTGGGGSGATASATVRSGVIKSLALTFPGFGYTAPVVAITDSGGPGAGATATAAVDPVWGLVTSLTLTNGGSGYVSPVVTITNTGAAPVYAATATAALAPAGMITAINLVTPGTGYTSAPLVTITDSTGTGAVATANLSGIGNPAFNPATLNAPLAAAFAATQPAPIVPIGTYAKISDTSMTINGVPVPLQPKTIQELFDPAGRMNATLGVEIPFTTSLIQTTIPYGFIDPATEVIPDGATQLWKITHNGVDTHVIHFHLFNVQVVNRVGWDGAVKPPWPEELGWKETVKMNPLEDIVVALRAKIPTVPFAVPDNIRPLDPTQPTGPGNVLGFTLVDPNSNPVSYYNQAANFGKEYTWHCHILGHEENDMMRPIMIAAAPAAPTGLVAAAIKGPYVLLTWVNGLGTATGLTIDRALDAAFTTGLTSFSVGPSVTTYTDKNVAPLTPYFYRVSANGAIVGSGIPGFPSASGVTTSGTATVTTFDTPPAKASNLTAVASALSTNPPTITLNWVNHATNATSISIQRAANSTFTLNLVSTAVAPTTSTYVDSKLTPQTPLPTHTTFYYRVVATNSGGSIGPSNVASATTRGILPLAPSNLTGSAVVIAGSTTQDKVTLNWVNNATNATGFTIEVSSSSTFATMTAYNVGVVTTYTQNVSKGVTLYYRVRASNADGVSTWSNTRTVITP